MRKNKTITIVGPFSIVVDYAVPVNTKLERRFNHIDPLIFRGTDAQGDEQGLIDDNEKVELSLIQGIENVEKWKKEHSDSRVPYLQEMAEFAKTNDYYRLGYPVAISKDSEWIVFHRNEAGPIVETLRSLPEDAFIALCEVVKSR